MRQRGRGVGGAERGRALVAEPGLLELATEDQVVVAEDEDPTPGTGPELLDQVLVVERSRVGDVAEAHDGVVGRDVVAPSLEHPGFHGAEVGEPPAGGLESATIAEVEVGPDPRLSRRGLDDPDRLGWHEPCELVLGAGDAGDPRRQRGPLQEVLPQRGDGFCQRSSETASI